VVTVAGADQRQRRTGPPDGGLVLAQAELDGGQPHEHAGLLGRERHAAGSGDGALEEAAGLGQPPRGLAGEETIDGAATWRLDDRPEPGTTASYWIDQATHLPRRIALDRPGRRDLRIDFAYGSGPRPIRAVAYLQGQRDVQVTLTPTYQASGRVVGLQVVAQPSGGSPVTTDVTFDWSPSTSAEFFRFTPPAGATEVPFQQLSQGVLLMAAGALGSLLPVLLGAI
jgi:hypothetical protein